MVMLLHRIPADIFLRIKLTCLLSLSEVIDHSIRIDSCLDSQIYGSILVSIKNVITFLLCVMHSELFLNVLDERMHLKTQIATFHRIQKVKSDRELITESSIDIRAEKFYRMLEHQIYGWNLNISISKTKQKAVLLRNTVKTPCKVLSCPVQITNLFHPLTAPDSRIEIRHYSERSGRRLLQSGEECLRRYHLWLSCKIGVEYIIHLAVYFLLPTVEDTPIYKESLLVLKTRTHSLIIKADVRNFIGTETHLYFPSSHIQIYQYRRLIIYIRSSCSIYNLDF